MRYLTRAKNSIRLRHNDKVPGEKRKQPEVVDLSDDEVAPKRVRGTVKKASKSSRERLRLSVTPKPRPRKLGRQGTPKAEIQQNSDGEQPLEDENVAHLATLDNPAKRIEVLASELGELRGQLKECRSEVEVLKKKVADLEAEKDEEKLLNRKHVGLGRHGLNLETDKEKTAGEVSLPSDEEESSGEVPTKEGELPESPNGKLEEAGPTSELTPDVTRPAGEKSTFPSELESKTQPESWLPWSRKPPQRQMEK